MKCINQLASIALLSLSISACSTSVSHDEIISPVDQSALYGQNWTLAFLGDTKAAKGYGGKPLSILFDQNSQKISGFAGCNRYFSSFTVNNDGLNLGALGMTRKACGKNSGIEHRYSKMLSQVSFFQLSDKQLMLLDQQKNIIATYTK